MARVVKKQKRRKRKLTALAKMLIAIFSLSIVTLCVNIFYKTCNNELIVSIQKMNNELATLNAENRNLNNEIQMLENKQRVYELASASELTVSEDNIISIIGE